MSKIGVCKVDITPPLGIDFVGYHRETGINNIEERIYGTVFVFEKDEMKTVFISYFANKGLSSQGYGFSCGHV